MRSAHGDEHYQRIADLQVNGAMSQRQIADAYGVAMTTVARWIRVAKDKGLMQRRGYGVPPWSRHCPECGASVSRQGKAIA